MYDDLVSHYLKECGSTLKGGKLVDVSSDTSRLQSLWDDDDEEEVPKTVLPRMHRDENEAFSKGMSTSPKNCNRKDYCCHHEQKASIALRKNLLDNDTKYITTSEKQILSPTRKNIEVQIDSYDRLDNYC